MMKNVCSSSSKIRKKVKIECNMFKCFVSASSGIMSIINISPPAWISSSLFWRDWKRKFLKLLTIAIVITHTAEKTAMYKYSFIFVVCKCNSFVEFTVTPTRSNTALIPHPPTRNFQKLFV